jgi:hypothetical protein
MTFGEAASAAPTFALEAQMTHNLNHREQPVQKAGQTAGAARPPSPDPGGGNRRASAPEGLSLYKSSGAGRVAGGETMSQKTSTAALESFRHGPFPIQRRAPRHSAEAFVGPAFRLPGPKRGGAPFHCSAGFHASAFGRKSNFNSQEPIMNLTTQFPRRTFSAILPVILRIACSLFLWTLGASAMDLRVAQIQSKENRVVVNFPIDRAKAEDLQRWVNDGHDPWCRDPQLAAAAALRRVSSRFSEYELASLPVELESSQKTKAVYTFHSLDGRTGYRITVRRYRFLLPSAGSLQRIIWIPETAEIITRVIRD